MEKANKIGLVVVGGAILAGGVTIAVLASRGSGGGGSGTPGTTLTGKVSDPSGNPIQGVTVAYGGVSAKTDVAGDYTFDKVPAGAVSVSCSATGYQTMSLTTIVVAAQTNFLNFTMQPTQAFGQSTVIENMSATSQGSWTILFLSDQSGNIGAKPYVFYVMLHNAPPFDTESYSIVSIDGNSDWQQVEAASAHKFKVGDVIYQPNQGYPDYGVHEYKVTAWAKQSDGVYRYTLTATDDSTIVTYLPVGYVDASWALYTSPYKFAIGDQIYNTANPAAVYTIVGITTLGGVAYYDFNGNWGEAVSVVDDGVDPTFGGTWELYTGSTG